MNSTLPETNIAHENPVFLGKYHQNGGFSMAMLVYRRVPSLKLTTRPSKDGMVGRLIALLSLLVWLVVVCLFFRGRIFVGFYGV